jgi:hypothetical protein
VRSELAQAVNDQVLDGVLATVLVFVLFATLLTLI